jgi:hypothetical protein
MEKPGAIRAFCGSAVPITEQSASEFEADADGNDVLVEVGIDAQKVLAAVIIVAIFNPSEDVVGKGIIDTCADRPAREVALSLPIGVSTWPRAPVQPAAP